ncbi:MAG: hypothetical protein HY543_01165 [Deltaproteobacteria bacterium]|nr:hypothetical protein [Deltaproteobacteria bacterium]
MNDRNERHPRIQIHPAEPMDGNTMPPEVAGIVGGVTRRVRAAGGKPSDSMLAVYKDRFTYTFIFQEEVASIHFDPVRKEIYFKGHNIRYMDLTDRHVEALLSLVEVLLQDREAKTFAVPYRETLARLLADKL